MDIPKNEYKKYGLTKPPRKIRLYNAIKAGYARNPKRASRYLKKFGYIVDRDLSDSREYITAYNPIENKVLHIANGTDPFSVRDVASDLLVGLGSYKDTARYKQEKNALEKARDKYKGAKMVLTGHSLGGQVLHNIAKSDDEVFSYNPAYAFNQKIRPNFNNYRTDRDLFSVFSPPQNTTILDNPHEHQRFRPIANILNAHNTENIRDAPIFL